MQTQQQMPAEKNQQPRSAAAAPQLVASVLLGVLAAIVTGPSSDGHLVASSSDGQRGPGMFFLPGAEARLSRRGNGQSKREGGVLLEREQNIPEYKDLYGNGNMRQFRPYKTQNKENIPTWYKPQIEYKGPYYGNSPNKGKFETYKKQSDEERRTDANAMYMRALYLDAEAWLESNLPRNNDPKHLLQNAKFRGAIVGKLNTGICLSGGGVRAMSFALGILRGLYMENELLRQYGRISGTSGGAWATGLYSYAREDISEDELLAVKDYSLGNGGKPLRNNQDFRSGKYAALNQGQKFDAGASMSRMLGANTVGRTKKSGYDYRKWAEEIEKMMSGMISEYPKLRRNRQVPTMTVGLEMHEVRQTLRGEDVRRKLKLMGMNHKYALPTFDVEFAGPAAFNAEHTKRLSLLPGQSKKTFFASFKQQPRYGEFTPTQNWARKGGKGVQQRKKWKGVKAGKVQLLNQWKAEQMKIELGDPKTNKKITRTAFTKKDLLSILMRSSHALGGERLAALGFKPAEHVFKQEHLKTVGNTDVVLPTVDGGCVDNSGGVPMMLKRFEEQAALRPNGPRPKLVAVISTNKMLNVEFDWEQLQEELRFPGMLGPRSGVPLVAPTAAGGLIPLLKNTGYATDHVSLDLVSMFDLPSEITSGDNEKWFARMSDLPAGRAADYTRNAVFRKEDFFTIVKKLQDNVKANKGGVATSVVKTIRNGNWDLKGGLEVELTVVYLSTPRATEKKKPAGFHSEWDRKNGKAYKLPKEFPAFETQKKYNNQMIQALSDYGTWLVKNNFDQFARY